MRKVPATSIVTVSLLVMPLGWCLGDEVAPGHITLSPPETDLPDIHSSQADDLDQGKNTLQSRVLDRKADQYGMEASATVIEKVNIRATYAERPVIGINQVMNSRGSPLGAWSLRLDSSLADGAFKVFGEADTAFLDPLNNRQADQNDQGMMKMGFSGGQGAFSYGAVTGFVGNGHRNPLNWQLADAAWRGKQRTEVWSGWQVGNLNIKTSAMTSTRLKTKATDPLIKDQQVGLTLDYLFSSWPSFGASVSYFNGRYTGDHGSNGANNGSSVPFNRFVANTYFSTDTWNAYASSSFAQSPSLSSNTAFPETDTYHSVGASFYPNGQVNMDLSLGLYQQRYSYGAQMSGFDSSLSIGYKPEGNLPRFSSFVYYAKSRNDSWYFHTSSLNLDNSVTWLFAHDSIFSSALSLHLGYNAYLDRFSAGSSQSDLYAGVLFTLGRPVGLGFNAGSFLGACGTNSPLAAACQRQ